MSDRIDVWLVRWARVGLVVNAGGFVAVVATHGTRGLVAWLAGALIAAALVAFALWPIRRPLLVLWRQHRAGKRLPRARSVRRG